METRRSLVAAGFLLLGACASPRPEAGDPALPGLRVQSAVAGLAPAVRASAGGRAALLPAPSEDEIVELKADGDGIPALDFLRMVTERTGISFVYDGEKEDPETNARIRFTGTRRIPRSRLFDVGRALLWEEGVALVRCGPQDAGEVWTVCDYQGLSVQWKRTFVAEADVPALADADGVSAVTVLGIPEGVDPAQVRAALQSLSTKEGGFGAVTEVADARALVVRDLGPVVASMKRVVDALRRPPSAPAGEKRP